MAARVRNSDWQEDDNLRDDLVKNVRQNLRQKEILDLVQIKYPVYAWSPCTLTRQLPYFGIWSRCRFDASGRAVPGSINLM